MGIVQFFKKLVGGKPEESRGPSVPRPQWYSDMVTAHLERVGLRIEQRNLPPGVQATANINAIFEHDAERQAADYYRRQSGDSPLVGAGRQFTVPDHLRQGDRDDAPTTGTSRLTWFKKRTSWKT
jgi:hypothetical protein